MSGKYHHLSLDERRKLYFMRQDKASIEEIANVLGRHRSTIYREIKRNYFYDELELFREYFSEMVLQF